MHVLRSYPRAVRGWLAALALAALCLNVAHAATASGDTFPKSFTSQSGGTSAVWKAPGTTIGAATAASGARVWSQTATGVRLTESGAVTLEAIVQQTERVRNLEKIVEATIAASRNVSAADVLAGARLGPWGAAGVAATLIALPALKTWVDSDNAEHIRVKADGSGFEKKGSPTLPQSDGYEYYNYQTGQWVKSYQVACNSLLGTYLIDKPDRVHKIGNTWGSIDDVQSAACEVYVMNPQAPNPVWVLFTTWPLSAQHSSGCPKGWFITASGGCTQTPGEADWLPASMDDIAPYLTNKPVPLPLPQQILDKGGTLQSTPGGTSGPASPINNDPQSLVEQVPTPPSTGSDSTRRGNPYNLPDNTPTTTSTSTGSQPVQMPDGTTVNNPSRTTRISTFNPTSNTTSDHTETTFDPLRRETTTTTSTSMDYGPSSVTSNTSTTNVTNIINNITNQTINTTTNTTNATPASDQKSDCDAHPNTVGCMEPGDPPPSDTLNKQTKEFQFSPVTFASSASCPPPATFTLGFPGIEGTYEMPYDGICSFMELLKILVIAMGAFAAAWIVADEFRVA